MNIKIIYKTIFLSLRGLPTFPLFFIKLYILFNASLLISLSFILVLVILRRIFIIIGFIKNFFYNFTFNTNLIANLFL